MAGGYYGDDNYDVVSIVFDAELDGAIHRKSRRQYAEVLKYKNTKTQIQKYGNIEMRKY